MVVASLRFTTGDGNIEKVPPPAPPPLLLPTPPDDDAGIDALLPPDDDVDVGTLLPPDEVGAEDDWEVGV